MGFHQWNFDNTQAIGIGILTDVRFSKVSEKLYLQLLFNYSRTMLLSDHEVYDPVFGNISKEMIKYSYSTIGTDISLKYLFFNRNKTQNILNPYFFSGFGLYYIDKTLDFKWNYTESNGDKYYDNWSVKMKDHHFFALYFGTGAEIKINSKNRILFEMSYEKNSALLDNNTAHPVSYIDFRKVRLTPYGFNFKIGYHFSK